MTEGALEQVEVVRALVGQHATALARPRAAPATTVLQKHGLRLEALATRVTQRGEGRT